MIGRLTAHLRWFCPEAHTTRDVYLRVVGLTFLASTLSYWSQIIGLNGIEGIAPAVDLAESLAQASARYHWGPWERFLSAPSAFFLAPGDGTLHLLCGIATLGSLLLVAGALPGPALLLYIVGWGSVVAVGGVFTGYQWDIFNVEVAFASLLVAPWSLRLSKSRPPAMAGIWALRGLLWKFMLLGGVVKWNSGDPSWRDLTALRYHFWTQPIPHGLSWWAHQAPELLLRGAVVSMFVVELVLPWFVFGPRRVRHIAAIGTAALMTGIVATGNYGTFNLLTVALCIPLLDDGLLRSSRKVASAPKPPSVKDQIGRAGILTAALCLLLLDLCHVARRADPELTLPAQVTQVTRWARQLKISASYGAFARMTKTRPEIALEVSDDGAKWTPITLRYKTLALDRAHGFAGPHMPRVDWQLWFAALAGRCQRARWTLGLFKGLLEGRPAVWALFDAGPPRRPRLLRSTLWAYEFEPAASAKGSGHVWRRRRLRAFCPDVTLRAGGLRVAPTAAQ